MDFVTIRVFTLPTDLVVAKSRLESEGIECRVIDELTIQTDNFLSNAIGGVKLQVSNEDFDKADSILESGGFGKGKPARPSYLEKKLQSAKFRKRLVWIIILTITILIGAIFISNTLVSFHKTDDPTLADNTWSLEYMMLNGETHSPSTKEIIPLEIRDILHPTDWGIKTSREKNTITFGDETASFPGFNSFKNSVLYTIENGYLKLSKTPSIKTPQEEYVSYLKSIQTEKNISDSLLLQMEQDYIQNMGIDIERDPEPNIFEKQLPVKLLIRSEKDTLRLVSDKMTLVLSKAYSL